MQTTQKSILYQRKLLHHIICDVNLIHFYPENKHSKGYWIRILGHTSIVTSLSTRFRLLKRSWTGNLSKACLQKKGYIRTFTICIYAGNYIHFLDTVAHSQTTVPILKSTTCLVQMAYQSCLWRWCLWMSQIQSCSCYQVKFKGVSEKGALGDFS